jgi:hypothetical protein
MIDALSPGPLVQAVSAEAGALPHDAMASDAERFRALMNTAPPEANPALTAAELGRPLASATAPQGPSIGQSILGTVQDLAADTRDRFAKAQEVLSKPDLSMSDLLSLQFTLLQTSVQFEIASKGISKMAQNVDAVLKTQ